MEIHIKVDVSLAVYYLIQLVFLVFLQNLIFYRFGKYAFTCK